MKKLFVIILVLSLVLIALVSYVILRNNNSDNFTSPLAKITKKEYPLNQYTFPNLTRRVYSSSPITLLETLEKEEQYTSHLFTYISDDKTISGQINLPANPDPIKKPVVIMLRGFVDPSIYQTGIGTKNAASVFARNGFITIAPDFAGFGLSDPEDENTFIARFQKPIDVLNLIESAKNFEYADPSKIFIWGHSNGGQIALSVLEISQANYPTTLWAPVSKPFPYNILYYTDEFDDLGKALRKSLAIFEADYDTNLFSIHKYYNQINAPIQIHQGGADDAIPLEWSNELAETLKQLTTESGEQKLDITLFTYPQADHNLRPNWNQAVSRDLEFFHKFL